MIVVAVARPAAADTTYRASRRALHIRGFPPVHADDVLVDRQAVGRGVVHALQLSQAVAGQRSFDSITPKKLIKMSGEAEVLEFTSAPLLV